MRTGRCGGEIINSRPVFAELKREGGAGTHEENSSIINLEERRRRR